MTDDGTKVIASLTTYPKRFDFLKSAIDSILTQTAYSIVDEFYINVDDNLTDQEYCMYNSLLGVDPKIRIKVCPAKWRSCNKLVWVYKDNPDSVIICFDDDKRYPRKTIERLYSTWTEHRDCIVSYEINPISCNKSGQIEYLNSVDIKLLQMEYGKYLSNACLFPPKAFTDLIFDYDSMMEITNGNHDELWFWIVSTLNGVKCIGLDYTFSLSADEGVQLCSTDSDLTNINADPETISEYNRKINEKYGNALMGVVMKNPVVFNATHSNIFSIIGNIYSINSIYGRFPILVNADETVSTSWIQYLARTAGKFKWNQFRISQKRGC